MRLRLTSAYEYLERRFSYRVRLLGATLFILLRLGWMSMVVFAASMALGEIVGETSWLPGRDRYWWILTIGLVAAVYTAIGGIQAVIWVDVLQCVLLLRRNSPRSKLRSQASSPNAQRHKAGTISKKNLRFDLEFVLICNQ